MKEQTTEPVSPCHTAELKPEFGRIRDVERLYGIKRGTLYGLLGAGRIRGCLLRVKGNRSGVRLIDLQSVRNLIHAHMDQQNSPVDSSTGFKNLRAGQAQVSHAAVRDNQ